eukprot:TRINITY_DN18185_c0_g1_i1.p1 TRINITY_DN18185_c0_g1~~TRINITY_DN18185_c0_g1_i1.p1  ORF type:complete len:118 (-),score=10.60 TRINITY_DN18185_c0_g1_i1:167-520(-)
MVSSSTISDYIIGETTGQSDRFMYECVHIMTSKKSTLFFFQMIRRPPRSTHCISSAASDVYKRQTLLLYHICSVCILTSLSSFLTSFFTLCQHLACINTFLLSIFMPLLILRFLPYQ